MLEINGLSVRVGACPLLRRVTLHVAAGEVVALAGEAGSGKSTLLRTLSGLLPRAEGSVRFDGRPLDGSDTVVPVQAGLVQVAQGGRLFPAMSVRDNLLLGATLRGREQRQLTLGQVLEVIPLLRGGLDRRAGTLDGLQQQMLAIGRALMARPILLMLDEPTQDLGDQDAGEVLRLLGRLHGIGLPLLLATRSLRRVQGLASRCCILEHGHVAQEGFHGADAKDL